MTPRILDLPIILDGRSIWDQDSKNSLHFERLRSWRCLKAYFSPNSRGHFERCKSCAELMPENSRERQKTQKNTVKRCSEVRTLRSQLLHPITIQNLFWFLMKYTKWY